MKWILILVIFLLAILSISAQKLGFDKSTYYNYGTQIYSEVFVLPNDTKDSGDVALVFKFLYDALSFNQVNPLENPAQFRAVAEAEIMFQDEQGIIRGRVNWQDTAWVNKFEETNSKNKYFEGYVIKRLPIGKYKIYTQLVDKLKHSSEKKELEVEAINFNTKNRISKPIFGNIIENKDGRIFIPYIWDGNIDFSSNKLDVIAFVSDNGKNPDYSFNLKKIKSTNIDFFGDSINITSQVTAERFMTLNNPVLKSINRWTLSKSEYLFNNTEFYLLHFSLPMEKLSTGSYKLTIYDNQSLNDSIVDEFDVRWINMPLSLQDIDYATKIMYFILNDDDYDKIRSGNDKEMIIKLSEYWKKIDPTPLTPFNEALDQYFGRVDYAFFNFQTVRERDGARTERGKIYILYGTPDNVENKFVSGKTRETWIYKTLKKKFIFEINDKGVFQLIAIES